VSDRLRVATPRVDVVGLEGQQNKHASEIDNADNVEEMEAVVVRMRSHTTVATTASLPGVGGRPVSRIGMAV
jgi:hypothetical protein